MSKRYPRIDNDRGLKLYGEMKCVYGSMVTVRESSGARSFHGREYWLFIKGGSVEKNDGAALLKPHQVRQLIRALQRTLDDKPTAPKAGADGEGDTA